MNFLRSGRLLAAVGAALTLALPSTAQTPSFVKGVLNGANPNDPTSLSYGPDGRLYVAERYGVIHIYTIERLGEADYTVTASETLNNVYSKPNRDDDGTLNPGTQGRQCTGILAVGTPTNPVIYVTSSDPRVAVGNDSGLDTNSGILTRLTWNGSSWDELDIVRGLPRCEENHASNGMALDPVTNTLYMGSGGNTNMGAPSNNFGMTPEYALSAAMLTVDLDMIGETTYDLPTLDDPSRSNTGPGGSDVNDPFGGNDGANQAIIVAGGPVQVYASGLRNPYDVLLHSDGSIYTIDNGPNTGWGGPAINCSNDPNEADSAHNPDALHRIGMLGDSGGYYGGHPNPFRGSSSATINGQSPIPPGTENPAECVYIAPGSNGSLTSWQTSTNGLCEYTASNFSGAMQGDLLTVGYGTKKIERVQLNPDGSLASSTTLLSSVATQPLDIVAHGDNDEFPGTLWVAAFGNDSVIVFEPTDLVFCSGDYSLLLDDDSDGYTNADEVDNGTDPCSAGDLPADFDGDLISDLNDPDDDGDGIADVADPFAIDALNGAATPKPFHFGWGVGDPGTGFFGLGFTGLMTNGADYLTQFVPADVIAGGAAGKFTVDHVGSGDALGAQNDQQAAFQVGVVADGLGPFTLKSSVEAPLFGGLTPIDGQSHGIFIGDGGQDDYVKVVLGAGGGTGALEVVIEEGGTVLENQAYPAAVLGALSIELSLTVDPEAGTIQPSYSADGGAQQLLGGARVVPSSFIAALSDSSGFAVGVIATAGPTGPTYAATWDYLEITQDSTATAAISVGPAGGGLTSSTETTGAFRIENTAVDGQEIESVTFDLSSGLLRDMVFDPNGTAGDSSSKAFTADSGDADTGLVSHVFSGDHDGGFDRLTLVFDDFQPGEVFTFSVDVDPTSIQGASAPGPNNTAAVSGLELTGAGLAVGFDDGSSIIAQLYQGAGSLSESVARVRTALPVRPDIEVVGLSGYNLQLPSTSQTLQVSGPVGANVRMIVAEGGLYVFGVPNNGFDIDPFESNTLVSVSELSGTIGAGGTVDLPFQFGQTDPKSGHYLITAVIEDPDGTTSVMARPIFAELEPAILQGQVVDFGSTIAGVTETLDAVVENVGVGLVNINSIQLTGDSAFALGATPALPVSLLGGQTTTIGVEFSPTAPGPVTGQLLVHHGGEGSPLAIDLLGEGTMGDLEILFRVNCGGPELAATDGTQPWTEDTETSPSQWGNSANTNVVESGDAVIPHSSAPSTAPASLFTTSRTDAKFGSNVKYSFPIATDTLVEVRLLLAENSPAITGAGQRVFNATIEGNLVEGIDPFAEAKYGVGYARSAVVEVTDGTLNVNFSYNLGDPSIKGIEVRRPGSLVSSRPLISSITGGTQTLFLSAGDTFANDTYIVLSSLSGSVPGLPLGLVVVPLNFDSMTIFSIENANSGPYVNSLGILDADGRAEAAFVVPSALPAAAVGLELTHAGVLFEGSAVTAASDAVTVELTD